MHMVEIKNSLLIFCVGYGILYFIADLILFYFTVEHDSSGHQIDLVGTIG